MAITLAYISIRKLIARPSNEHLVKWNATDNQSGDTKGMSESGPVTKSKYSSLFAILVPGTFLAIIIYMVLAKFSDVLPSLEGGAGAALIGGASLILLIGASFFLNARTSLQTVSDNIVKGFLFAFKAMGPVIPIAGFFFRRNLI